MAMECELLFEPLVAHRDKGSFDCGFASRFAKQNLAQDDRVF